MRVRIENVTLVTTDETNRVFENGCLVWEDDTILALNDFSMHVDEVIDGQGGLLLPGMVNTHCHLGMIPFRSLGDDCPDRLRRFLFPLENAAMTRELAQASARYAAAEMMLAVLLEKGWSVSPDGEAADRLRALARGENLQGVG